VDFGLLQKDQNWNVMHVSGHGSADQIQGVVEQTHAKSIIPIHTVHSDYFKKWHDNVAKIQINDTLSL